ncbi:hypothetical protein ACUXK4_004885 [Methylorubrum extorquens]
MGIAPDVIRGMSLWAYKAAVEGWNKANGGGEGGGGTLNDREAQEIASWLDEPPVWER